MSRQEVIVFNPTTLEHQAVTRHLAGASFKNFSARAVLTGPGKINAAFKMAQEVLPMLAKGETPAALVGAGTSGSLNKHLKSGDMIASASAIISDWKMVDDDNRRYGLYDELEYQPLDAGAPERLAIDCPSPLVRRLMADLESRDFKIGRLMSSDTFVAGVNNKLSQGKRFQCLACDMESGVFGYLANTKLGGLPWFNLRVVADTLEHDFDDYREMEEDMTDILGRHLVTALQSLDALTEA